MYTFLILCLINTFTRRFFDYDQKGETYVSFKEEFKKLFSAFFWSIPTVLLILFVVNLLT